MSSFFKAPSMFTRKAFFFLALSTAFCGHVCAQAAKNYRPIPNYVQLGTPDKKVGAQAIQEFRAKGIAGAFYLEFELTYIPRRGAAVTSQGRLWGMRIGGDNVIRISIQEGAGESRYLISGGSKPQAWKLDPGASAPRQLGDAEVLKPFLGGALSPFELQMSYVSWNDFTYEGLAKVLGRPAHSLLMYPPAGFDSGALGLTGVRVCLDTQYGALVRAEILGAEGKVMRTLSLSELKKVSEQWIVKTLEVRDETLHAKTRLAFNAAALNLDLSPSLFDPANLVESVAAPSPMQRF